MRVVLWVKVDKLYMQARHPTRRDQDSSFRSCVIYYAEAAMSSSQCPRDKSRSYEGGSEGVEMYTQA